MPAYLSELPLPPGRNNVSLGDVQSLAFTFGVHISKLQSAFTNQSERTFSALTLGTLQSHMLGNEASHAPLRVLVPAYALFAMFLGDRQCVSSGRTHETRRNQ
jgi:hypothetical protein